MSFTVIEKSDSKSKFVDKDSKLFHSCNINNKIRIIKTKSDFIYKFQLFLHNLLLHTHFYVDLYIFGNLQNRVV